MCGKVSLSFNDIKTKDNKIFKRLAEHLEKVQETYNNDYFVIALQGSQNYGIADEESDIDTKCLIIPTFDQLVFNKQAISHTLIMDNDEHCDVKDVREYFKIVRKSNINFVEIFFTKWYIVNPKYEDLWNYLIDNNERIARMNLYRAIAAMRGMALEKYHALEHEYPSRMHMIEKFGYDPKQLSHLLRVRYFLEQFVLDKPYQDCINLQGNIKDVIYNVKRYGWPTKCVENYKDIAEGALLAIDELYNKYKNIYKNENDPIAESILDETLYFLIQQAMREELI